MNKKSVIEQWLKHWRRDSFYIPALGVQKARDISQRASFLLDALETEIGGAFYPYEKEFLLSGRRTCAIDAVSIMGDDKSLLVGLKDAASLSFKAYIYGQVDEELITRMVCYGRDTWNRNVELYAIDNAVPRLVWDTNMKLPVIPR